MNHRQPPYIFAAKTAPAPNSAPAPMTPVLAAPALDVFELTEALAFEALAEALD